GRAERIREGLTEAARHFALHARRHLDEAFVDVVADQIENGDGLAARRLSHRVVRDGDRPRHCSRAAPSSPWSPHRRAWYVRYAAGRCPPRTVPAHPRSAVHPTPTASRSPPAAGCHPQVSACRSRLLRPGCDLTVTNPEFERRARSEILATPQDLAAGISRHCVAALQHR